MCGGNRDPERKKAKNKKEWCLPSHKKRFQAFRVLKFRVFGGVFWFHIANIISSSLKKRRLLGGV